MAALKRLTTKEAADILTAQLGFTVKPNTVRRIAAKYDIGELIGRSWCFTAAQVQQVAPYCQAKPGYAKLDAETLSEIGKKRVAARWGKPGKKSKKNPD